VKRTAVSVYCTLDIGANPEIQGESCLVLKQQIYRDKGNLATFLSAPVKENRMTLCQLLGC